MEPRTESAVADGERACAERADAERADAESACAEGEARLGRRGVGGAGAAVGAGAAAGAAERSFRLALSFAPGTGVSARAHVGLGRLQLAAGQPDGALAEFHLAHDTAPDDSAPLFWLGCALAHQGELDAAEAHFTRCLASAEPHPRALVQRAYVRVAAGNREGARDDLRAAERDGVLDDEGRWVAAVLSGVRGAPEPDVRVTPEPEVRGAPEPDVRVTPEPEPQSTPEPASAAPRTAALLRKAGLAALAGADPDWPRAAALFGAAWDIEPDAGGRAALYGVALAVGGRRTHAVDVLATAARRDPSDHRVTHALAIALLNSPAQEPRTDGPPPTDSPTPPEAPASPAAPPCERAVAAWGTLLYDASFWDRVRLTAGRRYGVDVAADLVPDLRTGLRDRVARHLPDEGDSGSRVPPDVLLQREADAARLLDEAGGFPGPWGTPLRCGPLAIAALDQVRQFGAFTATGGGAAIATGADAETGTGADTGTSTSTSTSTSTETGTGTGTAADTDPAHPTLIHPFSELGFAHLQLTAGLPGDALAALAELRCRGCRARARAAGSAAAPVCEPDCARFDALNPGYAGLPDRHRRLARDARELALHARVTLGRDHLTADRPDFGAAAACWRRALVHSRQLDRYRHTQAAVVGLALAAAKDAYRAGRLTRAAGTLETARSVIGANERPRLDGQLARVLADRGIREANREDPDLETSASDLRRSVAIAPRLRRAQLSLGIVLHGLALRRWGSGSLSGARTSLEEAVGQLTAALTHFPDDPEITEQRDRVQGELDFVRGQFDESWR
ncbi:hypothetical protein [Streptomyces sp. RK9]|uniref:hypothetical protein n=1 Tax=Streptomyces sp. RK9 TaxID=3239284 RepID=UPI00386E713F